MHCPHVPDVQVCVQVHMQGQESTPGDCRISAFSRAVETAVSGSGQAWYWSVRIGTDCCQPRFCSVIGLWKSALTLRASENLHWLLEYTLTLTSFFHWHAQAEILQKLSAAARGRAPEITQLCRKHRVTDPVQDLTRYAAVQAAQFTAASTSYDHSCPLGRICLSDLCVIYSRQKMLRSTGKFRNRALWRHGRRSRQHAAHQHSKMLKGQVLRSENWMRL